MKAFPSVFLTATRPRSRVSIWRCANTCRLQRIKLKMLNWFHVFMNSFYIIETFTFQESSFFESFSNFQVLILCASNV